MTVVIGASIPERKIFSAYSRLELPAGMLWIAALPLSIVFLGDLVLDMSSSRFELSTGAELPSPVASIRLDIALQEASGRLWFLISWFCVVVLSIGAFVFVAIESFGFLTRRSFRALAMAFFGSLAVFVLASIVGLRLGILRDAVDILGPNVVGAAERWASQLGGPGFLITNVEAIVRLATPPLAAAAAGIVFATIACTAEPAPEMSVLEKAAIWREQSRRLERNLQIGAVVLVAGIIFHICWTSWPQFLFRVEDGSDGAKRLEAFRAVVSAFTGYKALQYSLLLASFYVPVACLLWQRANTIALEYSRSNAQDGRGTGDLAGIHKELCLVHSGLATFRTLLSILAPIASGVVAQLLQALAK